MTVKLHQPVAGLDRGEDYTGPLEGWLLANGYASASGDNTDKAAVQTALPAAEDATSALNREASDADEVDGIAENPEDAHEPVEKGDADRDVEPQQQRIVPLLGADEPEESVEAAAERDGRVDPDEVEPAQRVPAPEDANVVPRVGAEPADGDDGLALGADVATAKLEAAREYGDDTVAAEAQLDEPSVATAQPVEKSTKRRRRQAAQNEGDDA